MPKLNFDPSVHGYHFANSFKTQVLPGVLPDVTTDGLCGGMVMSALDYWRAGVAVPTHEPSDFGGSPVPSEASALRRYIFDRQMNSLLTSLMFTRWIVSPWIGPDDFHNWAIGSEFEIVKNQIHMGRPAMLGLWGKDSGTPAKGHQVLCYGYDNNPKRLYVYDPNHPNEESTLTPVSPALGVISEGIDTHEKAEYHGYFFTDVYNWGENPPHAPNYRDLVVTSGLSLTPEDPQNLVFGKRLSCSVTVTNIGEFRSRFKQLFIWVRGPRGENLDQLLGGAEPGISALHPGESRTIIRTENSFGARPGTYTVGISYLSNQNHWILIPPITMGLKTSETITLSRPGPSLVVDRVINVPESQRSDLRTSVILRPGDEFALTGSGMIWAGVWFTGLNGPEGWADRIERNTRSPMNNQPDAHPYALIGRFENQPYFYIGRGLPRRAYMLAGSAELLLRTNDNAPGNGSGSFQCRIQVWRQP